MSPRPIAQYVRLTPRRRTQSRYSRRLLNSARSERRAASTETMHTVPQLLRGLQVRCQSCNHTAPAGRERGTTFYIAEHHPLLYDIPLYRGAVYCDTLSLQSDNGAGLEVRNLIRRSIDERATPDIAMKRRMSSALRARCLTPDPPQSMRFWSALKRGASMPAGTITTSASGWEMAWAALVSAAAREVPDSPHRVPLVARSGRLSDPAPVPL